MQILLFGLLLLAAAPFMLVAVCIYLGLVIQSLKKLNQHRKTETFKEGYDSVLYSNLVVAISAYEWVFHLTECDGFGCYLDIIVVTVISGGYAAYSIVRYLKLVHKDIGYMRSLRNILFFFIFHSVLWLFAFDFFGM